MASPSIGSARRSRRSADRISRSISATISLRRWACGIPGASSMPPYSNDAEFFPGTIKKWGVGFMINTESVPGRRGAGCLAWAGLGNTYFWIDPGEGVAGVILAQLIPFADPKVLELFGQFETAVYAGLR